jgi:hypothetical protein
VKNDVEGISKEVVVAQFEQLTHTHSPMHKDCFKSIAVLKELVITANYLTGECTKIFVVSWDDNCV